MDDVEIQEYLAVQKAVSDFDQRLLTIKGWGVTLSLAALGFGFQYKSYGLFLVAAASSLAFWALEGSVKRHQMRYYLRMLQIEVNRYAHRAPDAVGVSSPRIHWTWTQANRYFDGTLDDVDEPPRYRKGKRTSYRLAWMLPHVALPHAITFTLGACLFLLGYFGSPLMAGFALGSAAK